MARLSLVTLLVDDDGRAVAVFRDACGNRRDLLQPKAR